MLKTCKTNDPVQKSLNYPKQMTHYNDALQSIYVMIFKWDCETNSNKKEQHQ